MFFHRTAVRLTAAALCLTLAGASVSADGGEAPVFAPGVTGICVTNLPETGTVCLGSRVIRPGDVLTAEQAASLTLSHPETEADVRAVMEYLPMGPEGLGAEAELVFSLRGRKNAPPPRRIPKSRPIRICPTRGSCPCPTPRGRR